MRISSLALFMIIGAPSLFATERAMDAPATSGGLYVRPIAKLSSVWGSTAYWIGMEVGCSVTQDWRIGAAFNSLERLHSSAIVEDFGIAQDIQTKAYAGLMFTHTPRVGSRIHITEQLLIGDGWSGWERPPLVEGHHIRRLRFGIVEPALHLEANLSRVVSISTGASYMYTWGPGRWYSNRVPENFAFNLGLQITTW